MKSWIPQKTIIGNAATGDYYFDRPYINDEIWYEVVQKRSYVLMVAPRRVGKSSIMKNMVENCPEGCFCIYQNIEGISSKAEFYKRFYELILQCLNTAAKAKTHITSFIEKIGIAKISITGVEFKERPLDFLSAIRELINKLNELEVKVILFLDEFPEVISKLKRKNEQEDAIEILHNLREWRHDEKYHNFNLVLAGSVGLHQVVEEIDRPKIINDLHSVEIGSLSREEAMSFIKKATDGCTVQYDDTTMEILLQTVQDYLPYYLSLMLEEIDRIARRKNNPSIDDAIIQTAFNTIVENNRNFDDWAERLKDYMPQDYPFLNKILKHTAHKNSISVQEIYDIAAQFDRTEVGMKHVLQLVRDGYLQKKDSISFSFLSPFLKQYWLNNNPIL